MAESTLSLNRTELRKMLAIYLKRTPEKDKWNQSDIDRFDLYIREGLSRFYFPLSAEGQPYRWTFLEVGQSLSITSGTFIYTLPDTFGGQAEKVHITSAAADAIEIISPEMANQLRANDAASNAKPKYVAFRPLNATLSTSASTRWQAVFYPTPDDSYTISYHYQILPDNFSGDHYPLGGAAHVQAVQACCLAAAERFTNRDEQYWQQEAIRLMAASVAYDLQKREIAAATNIYAITKPAYGIYEWYQQEIGTELGLPPNNKLWGHSEIRKVDSLIQRGIAQFLNPESLPGARAHRWSFMYPETTITLSASYSTGKVSADDGVVTLTGGTFPSWAAEGDLVVSGTSYSVSARNSGTQLTLDDTSVDFGSAYSTGTVGVSSGVVTLSGGEWPSWAADGHISFSGTWYEVSTRDSNTQITLVNTGVNVGGGATYKLHQEKSYTLQRNTYDLPSNVRSLDGGFKYRPGDNSWRTVQMMSEHQIASQKQWDDASGYPQVAAVLPKLYAGSTGSVKQVKFFPSPDSAYVLNYRFCLQFTELAAGEYPPGDTEHAQTILMSCLSIVNPQAYMQKYVAMLNSSVELDQNEQQAEYLGQNSDHSDGAGYWHGDRNVVTFEGTEY